MSLTIRPLETIHGVVQNNDVITGVCVVKKPQTLLRERDNDVLLLHVTVTGSLRVAAELQNQLVDLFVETYYNTAGLISATLRHAVHNVNRHLLAANEGQEEGRTAVLCGVVVRGDTVSIVQVGQAQAFIGTADGVKEMTDYAPKRVAPLGRSDAIDFTLYQTKVQMGDTVLIVAPNLVDIPTQRIKPIIVDQPLEVAEQRLMHILTHRTARCILAQVTEPIKIVQQPDYVAQQPDSAYDSTQETKEIEWQAVHQPPVYNRQSRNAVSDTIWERIRAGSAQLDDDWDEEKTYDYDDINKDVLDDAVIAWDQTEMDGLEQLPAEYGIGEDDPTVFTPHTPSPPLRPSDSRPSELVDDEPPTIFYSKTETEDVNGVDDDQPSSDPKMPSSVDVDDNQPPTIFYEPQSEPKMQDGAGMIGDDLIAAEAIRRRRRKRVEKKIEMGDRDREVVSPPPKAVFMADSPIRKTGQFTQVKEMARQGSASLLYWLSNRVNGVAMALGRFNSNDEATAAERWLSFTFAVLTPIVVLIIVISAWLQGRQNQLLNGIRSDVGVAIERLDMVQTPAQKQVYYNYIINQIEIAEQYEENDVQLNGWKADFTSRLDRLNGMVNLKSERIVDYGSRVALKSFALGDEQAAGFYTLDTLNETVLYTPNDQNNSAAPSEIIRSKDAAGTHVVGDIIDIVWRDPVQGRNGVALLDRGGALVTQYADGERDVLTMGLSSNWITPIQMEMYAERVYILDRGRGVEGGRIWRYVPTANGLIIDENKSAIVLPDLDQAVDFAITNDGNIIVLYEDGRIRRYTTSGDTVTTIWDETTVRNSGLHQPMVAPRALALSDTGFQPAIFILDSGSGRIIQISPAGILQGQYRANNRDNVGDAIIERAVDISVQTAPLRVYLMTDTELFLAQD